MHVSRYTVDVVTDAEGAGVGFTPVCNGRVLNILYTKPQTGGYDDGVDFDITAETSGLVIWDQEDVNASATVAPRQATHTTAGVAALYAADGAAVNDYVYAATERIKVSVTDGGNKKTGNFVVLVG